VQSDGFSAADCRASLQNVGNCRSLVYRSIHRTSALFTPEPSSNLVLPLQKTRQGRTMPSVLRLLSGLIASVLVLLVAQAMHNIAVHRGSEDDDQQSGSIGSASCSRSLLLADLQLQGTFLQCWCVNLIACSMIVIVLQDMVATRVDGPCICRG
jgi:hypothetical protein